MSALSPADLAASAALPDTPFELLLPAAGGSRWFCREVLRALPGRRLVARAGRSSDGPDVLLKLFYGRGHRRYSRREQTGLERLRAAGLPVPAQIEARTEAAASWLVLDYLPDAVAVGDDDQAALQQVAQYFGRLHAAGYRQTDQHLGNFVGSGGVIYAVDGDGVRPLPRLYGRRAALDNLAVLAAQRAPARDGGLAGLLTAYGQGRGIRAPDLAAFRSRLHRARRGRVRRYLGKTRRDCTEFAVRRRRERVSWAVRGAGEMLLERLFAGPLEPGVTFLPGVVLKAGNSATIVRTAHGVVVKRFNVKNARHGMRRMLRRYPRYRRAWMFGQLLALLDIPTARPLVLVEERRLWCWRGVAYLVQADLEGVDLRAAIAAEGLSDARAAELAALFGMLQAAGLSHGDCKASNFIVHQGRVHLIDLDAMRLTDRGQKQDIGRFLDNWTGTERQRFEAAFAAAGLI